MNRWRIGPRLEALKVALTSASHGGREPSNRMWHKIIVNFPTKELSPETSAKSLSSGNERKKDTDTQTEKQNTLSCRLYTTERDSVREPFKWRCVELKLVSPA